jgi:hypothetical protein
MEKPKIRVYFDTHLGNRNAIVELEQLLVLIKKHSKGEIKIQTLKWEEEREQPKRHNESIKGFS